jgi:hypothetical protein
MDTEIMQLTGSSLEASTRAEIDVQIATARRFRRDIPKSIENARALATASPRVAAACHFAVPRGGKSIEGPSIRFAEILASTWGNLRCAARVVEVGQTEVVCQGIVHDLENNVAISKEVRRPIMYSGKSPRSGQRYDDDMINVTANAGCSIAMRNAIFATIPRAFWDEPYEATREVNRKVNPESRVKAMTWFATRGAPQDAILRVLGVRRVEDIGPDEMEQLVGWRNAIDEGATTIGDIVGSEPQSPGKMSTGSQPVAVPINSPEAPRRRGPGRPPKSSYVTQTADNGPPAFPPNTLHREGDVHGRDDRAVSTPVQPEIPLAREPGDEDGMAEDEIADAFRNEEAQQ